MKITLALVAFCFAALSFRSGAADGPEDYVAHEWGTFTSVQGSDGVLLEWRPLASSELPDFVYDRSKPRQSPVLKGALLPKNGYASTERMETPVIYFYPSAEMVVDVAVKFPLGLITEWYPMARSTGPEMDGDAHKPADGFIRWGKVRLFPAKLYPEFEKDLPTATSGSNYFAARETDSAFVRIGSPSRGIFEHEKFLFYRGVGDFKAPLEVQAGNAGISVRNTDTDAIPVYFVLTVGPTTASYSVGGALKGGESAQAPRDNAAQRLTPEENADALAKELQTALIGQGLYPREAAAMVKTWRDSWFLEQGTRVLYILPESWTPRMLPLTLSPEPRELKRVMVGRAELLTPQIEAAVASEVAGLASTDIDAREKSQKALNHLGRFAEPALARVIKTTTDEEVRTRATKLIAAMHDLN